jgi:hypothetical protein
MIGLLIALIMQFIGFLFSPVGMFIGLCGFLAFLGLPFVSMASGWESPRRVVLTLAALPIRRAAVVVSEHGDTVFKQMSFNARGVEEITLDGGVKEFEDPDRALHHWLGIPFAFADEPSGTLFDPRHAAMGMRKHELDAKGNGEFEATEAEWEEYGVSTWKPAVFEMPSAHELVDLTSVREIIDGGERAEYPKRVEEIYILSRNPFGDGTPAAKFIYPLIGLIGPFGFIWFMASQFGSGGGGGGGSVVSFGLAFLPAAPREWLQQYWKRLGLALLVPLLVVGSILTLGPLTLFNIVGALAVGLLAIPVLILLSQLSSTLGGVVSTMLFKLVLMSYKQPVLEWTPEKYRLREGDSLGFDVVNWYSLFGTAVGVTYAPDESSWGAASMPPSEVKNSQPVTDRGATPESNLPGRYVPSETIRRGKYGGALPKSVSESAYYISSAIGLARFQNSAVGEKSLRRLLEAKQEHGDGNTGLGDGLVFKATVGCGLVSTALGVFFFLL